MTTTKKVLKKKVLKCLCARKVVGIGILRPANIPQLITDDMRVVDIGLLRPAKNSLVITEVVDVRQV